MAEKIDKKDDKKKDKKEGGGGMEAWEIAAGIIIIFILFYIVGGLTSYIPVYNEIVAFFTKHSSSVSALSSSVSNDTKSIIGFLVGLSIPVSLVFFIGIIISVERLKNIRAKEHIIFNTPVEQAYDATAKGDPELSNRWKRILELVSSTNENDQRQAIIQADIILDDILNRMGYSGDGIGEKLKGVDRGDFKTLDQAWDAHKVRNMIAHEGPDFKLSQHEAKRVINLFQQVFEEFFYI
jgi:hypothetical protein